MTNRENAHAQLWQTRPHPNMLPMMFNITKYSQNRFGSQNAGTSECILNYTQRPQYVQDYSVELHSNSNLYSRNNVLFLGSKKVVKKGYYGNETLGLAWDCIKLS